MNSGTRLLLNLKSLTAQGHRIYQLEKVHFSFSEGFLKTALGFVAGLFFVSLDLSCSIIIFIIIQEIIKTSSAPDGLANPSAGWDFANPNRAVGFRAGGFRPLPTDWQIRRQGSDLPIRTEPEELSVRSRRIDKSVGGGSDLSIRTEREVPSGRGSLIIFEIIFEKKGIRIAHHAHI